MAPALQVGTSYRQILKIALPISLALLVPQMNFVTNAIFLGHLSEEALATASLTGVYYLVFSGIGFGLNNGLQAYISRRAGENKPQEIGVIFQQGIFIAMGIGALGILLTYLVAPLVFRSTIHSPKVYQDALSFLRIRIWGLPFLFIYQMRNALLVGINRSNLLVAGTAAEAVANVFFDYSFIFGHFGLPKLGFNGAAYASVIAEFTGMFVLFLVVRAKGISRQFSLFHRFAYNKEITWRILVLSGPLIFQMVISIGSWFFFYVLIEHHGQTSLAISNTMRNVFGFFGVFNWAFASAANTMVSNIIGQGKKEEVSRLITKIMTISMAISLVVCMLLNLFPRLYFSVFGQGENFAEEGTPTLRIVAAALVLCSAAVVWLNSVTGTGRSKITFTIELVAIVFYCTYVYVILEVKKLPIAWGWASELLYWTVIFTLSFSYMQRGKWKKQVEI
ncbi:MATE family efflux transporter [Flavisolibacter nicotianae]|uniref:MATE family efflux transporter n=1 Tax=Flavisolibacter nicotianae TaxID=2364882 RepID=UPI000EAC8FED|nr:MATE family efflux transporter [Flavisolibacter nicotianae]